jgi:hypothetical protein
LEIATLILERRKHRKEMPARYDDVAKGAAKVQVAVDVAVVAVAVLVVVVV